MNKYNVVWIYVDSVRNYHTEGDDRSRLEMMDDFSEESCEFLHAVTSAPSTWMSVTAMLTGLPSVYIAKNFNDFYFDNSYFDSVVKILKRQGYDCNFILHSRRSRELFQNFCPIIDRKFWPDGLKHRYKKWPNKVLNMVLKNYLDTKPQEPFFMFMGYNCRLDFTTSDVVDHAMKLFESRGFNSDNTVFILCSDHGYPDPSKNWSPEKFKELDLGHDLLLTDDNIQVPLFIKYPGCPKGIKIPYVVSLIDILPTLMSILSIYDEKRIDLSFEGKNLLPLINNKKSISDLKNRRMRTDNRLFCQTNRGTSIRGNNYKYIYYHDKNEEDNEEFYDLLNDNDEINNLIQSPNSEIIKSIDEFRKSFDELQQAASKFQLEHSLYRLEKAIEKQSLFSRTALNDILIYGEFPVVFFNHLVEILSKLFPNSKIHSLIDNSLKKGINSNLDIKPHFFNFNQSNNEELENFDYGIFDLIIVPIDINNAMTYDRHTGKKSKEIFKKSNFLKSKKTFFVDYNMNIIRKQSPLKLHLKKKYWDKRHIYLAEPSLFLIDTVRYLSIVYRKIKRSVLK